jgi:hypothetical protein
MTRVRMLILAVCVVSFFAAGRVARAEGVLEKLTGTWNVDFAKSTALPDIAEGDKEKLNLAGQNGLKISLTLNAEGAATVKIASPGAEEQNIKAEFKVLAEDDKGAFIHSITGGGQKKERVAVTYRNEKEAKIWFADIGYPLVFVK